MQFLLNRKERMIWNGEGDKGLCRCLNGVYDYSVDRLGRLLLHSVLSSPSKKALHSGPSEGAPVNHGKKERRSSGMVVVERRGSVKSGYAERHRRSSAAQLLELYNGRNRRVSRLEQLGVMSATRAVEASGTEFGMEFGDNVDDRNKKNPFTPRRWVLLGLCGSQF